MKNMSSFNRIKIISDENIPIGVTKLLSEKGYDVKKAPINSSDKTIYKIAKEESRIV